MAFPPEVYLIGAQKSGTTTLAYLLAQHPNICVANPKEPHFFSHKWDKSLDWYQSCFFNYKNAICIDASTTYSMATVSPQENFTKPRKFSPSVPQRIFSLNPHAKFIYLLRDPVERTYSGYWHNVSNGRETNEFAVALKYSSIYLDVSDYYAQLALWLEYFPIESFLFLVFEELRTNPEKVVRECFKFIGIQPENTGIELKNAKNKAKYVNVVGRRFNKLFKSLDHASLGYLAPSCFRGLVHKLTTDDSKELPKMKEKERLFLKEYFFENNQNLEILTGLPLHYWQT